MEKEPCKFRGVLNNFNEVIWSCKVLNLTQVTSYPQMYKTFHPSFSFHIFVNFTGLKLRKKYCFVKKLNNNVLCCVPSVSTIAMWSKISVSDFMI